MYTSLLPIDYEKLLKHLIDNYFIDDTLESITLERIKKLLDSHLEETLDPDGNDPDTCLTDILFEHFSFSNTSMDHMVGSLPGTVIVKDGVVIKMPLVYFNRSVTVI